MTLRHSPGLMGKSMLLTVVSCIPKKLAPDRQSPGPIEAASQAALRFVTVRATEIALYVQQAGSPPQIARHVELAMHSRSGLLAQVSRFPIRTKHASSTFRCFVPLLLGLPLVQRCVGNARKSTGPDQGEWIMNAGRSIRCTRPRAFVSRRTRGPFLHQCLRP